MKIQLLNRTRYVVVNGFLGKYDRKSNHDHHGPLRPGFHVMLRWDDNWNHFKLTLIRQQGIRISSQKQVALGAPRHYVTAYRAQFSLWQSRKGGNSRASKWGVMVYGTRPRKVVETISSFKNGKVTVS